MKIKNIRRLHKLLHLQQTLHRKTKGIRTAWAWLCHKLRFLSVLNVINPFHYISILDWYIIRKFIGTYIYSIILIISISIVFDVNENLVKFAQYHAPLKAIVFDYYANFVPYFANLFSPLFVFIAVIFFTSKLASNSEIISMLAAGVSFRRLMRPYMISCVLISTLSFFLSAYIIPHGTVVRQNFETMYKNKKKNTSAENVMLQMEPTDLVYSKGQQETFTNPELKEYIGKQRNRGNGNVVQYEVEYHKRIASSFASFILTTIGLSLSSRKRKGGMGMYLGMGLALSFGYIMLQTVSSTFAINANTPPILAAWIPNIIFAIVAYFCYRKAPN